MKGFGEELDDLSARFKEHRSPLLDRLMASIKLRLYSYALLPSHARGDGQDLDASDEKHASESPLEVANYTSKAYSVAMHIIRTSIDDHSRSDFDQVAGGSFSYDGQFSPCALWTFIDLQSFIMAVFTILHLSRKQQNLFDNKEVSDIIQRAWATLKSCSVVDGDHFYRVCDVINYLAAKVPNTDSDEPVEAEGIAPTLRPNMGTGVAYDIVKEAKKRYRRRKRFPEQFPEDLPAAEINEAATESTPGTDDWLQDPLSQSMFPDLDFLPWSRSNWDESISFGNGLPTGMY
jgi:hypothetical protein